MPKAAPRRRVHCLDDMGSDRSSGTYQLNEELVSQVDRQEQVS